MPPFALVPDREGVWSPRTASHTWCEPDYFHTVYVAELFNTISSLAVVLMASCGLYLCERFGYARRFWLSFACMFVVGCGSVAFHGTLRREGQALDELPMVFGTQVFLFIAAESAFLDGATKGALRFPWMPLALCAYCGVFTAGYFLLSGGPAFIFFVALYISGVFALVAMSVSLYWRVSRAAQWVGLASNVIYAGGFLVLWLPDTLLCSYVQPFSFHAWFHLTSTIGPYCGLSFLTFAHYQLRSDRAAAAAPTEQHKYAARAAVTEAEALRPELVFVLPWLPLPYVRLPRAVAATVSKKVRD